MNSALTTYMSEVRARLEAATKGPWQRDFQAPFGIGGAVCSMHNVTTSSWHPTHPSEEVCKQPFMDKRNKNRMFANGTLIANAPTDLTRALAIIEVQAKALERYANRKVKFHEGGGGKVFWGEWDSVHSGGTPFFVGEIWEEGSFAADAQAEVERLCKGTNT